MDAAKGQYLHFLPEVLRLLKSGGLLVSDNILQEGDLIEIDDFSELCDLDPSYCGYEAQGQEKSEEK